MHLPQLTKLEQKEISEVLTGFGLGEKDQNVYLGLLEMGQTSITPLSRMLNLPVTTVQSVMNRLVKVGIVEVSKKKSKNISGTCSE